MMDKSSTDRSHISLDDFIIMDHKFGDSTGDTMKNETLAAKESTGVNNVWSVPENHGNNHYHSPNPLQTLFGLQSLGTGLTPTPTSENINLLYSPNGTILTPKTNLEATTFRAIRNTQHSTGKKSNSSMASSSEPMDSSGISSGTDLSDSIFGDVMQKTAVSTAQRMEPSVKKQSLATTISQPSPVDTKNSVLDLQNAAMMAQFLNPSLYSQQSTSNFGLSGVNSNVTNAGLGSNSTNMSSLYSTELLKALWLEELKRQQLQESQILYSNEVLKLLNGTSAYSNYFWPNYGSTTGSGTTQAAASGSTTSDSTTAQTTASSNSGFNTNYIDDVSSMAALYRNFMTPSDDEIEKAANYYRNSASMCDANHHWSGKLPVRIYKNAMFSKKVFLGGVPWDVNDLDLQQAFMRFGSLQVMWPSKDPGGVHRSSPRGYCYLVFDMEVSVRNMLKQCTRDIMNPGEYYHKISSSKMKSKEVQVIPWCINDSQFTKQGSHRLDVRRTVFIGALHGMITAEALATIMNDLFGNVAFAALDTDKFKYPIGSGRVAFSNQRSYMKAVQANFVEIRTTKFTKTIQIDPYLEDSMCNHCFLSPGIYFCRAFECFRYFCPSCWNLWHSTNDPLYTHKPLRRTFKTNFSDHRK